MTKMTDAVRILLKAYGEELSLEQIIKVLNKKNKDEIIKAIPELISAKEIIETAPQTYKTVCEARPNYFFVFQNLTYLEELKNECLFANHSPVGKTVPHWESMEDVRKGDIIMHECGNMICAISEAQSEVRNAIRPYSTKDIDSGNGRRVDTMYVILHNQIDPFSVKDELSAVLPEKLAPFNKNGKGNEGYLFNFNEKSAKVIFNAMLARK